MRVRATPLAMTSEFFQSDEVRYGSLPGRTPVIGRSSDYDERQSLDLTVSSIEEALNETWSVFQNTSTTTPDRGRSLMVGDVIRVEDLDTDIITLHVIKSVGFEEIRSLKTIFGRETNGRSNG